MLERQRFAKDEYKHFGGQPYTFDFFFLIIPSIELELVNFVVQTPRTTALVEKHCFEEHTQILKLNQNLIWVKSWKAK